VLNQTIKVDRIIIVDDGSSLEAKIILSSILNSNEHLISVIRHEVNLGLLQALKTGFSICPEDCIVFRIDSDDSWCTNHVESILKYWDLESDLNFAASQAFTIDSKTNIKLGVSSYVENCDLKRKLLWDNPFVHSSIAFDKKLYDLVGGYQFNSYCLDYDLIVRLSNVGNFHMVPFPTVFYFFYLDSLSRSTNRKLIYKDRFAVQFLASRLYFMAHPALALSNILVVMVRYVFTLFMKE
jgi:glycosyltransferase involved in cell wall biosynthesis